MAGYYFLLISLSVPNGDVRYKSAREIDPLITAARRQIKRRDAVPLCIVDRTGLIHLSQGDIDNEIKPRFPEPK